MVEGNPQVRKVYAIDSDKMKFRYTTKERVGRNGFGCPTKVVWIH